MTETSLWKNYKLLAINEKRMEPVAATDQAPVPEATAEPPAEKVEEQPEPEKSGRAAVRRVMLKEAGQAFLKTHEAQVVYGEKMTQ